MPRLVHVGLALFVALLALAQPGLCGCWLVADVTGWHPHPAGMAQQPHDHGYLNDLFTAEAAAAGPIAALPVALWMLHAAARTLVRLRRAEAHLAVSGWQPRLDPPPPRLLAF
jgi:hypothetical protein